MARDIHIYSRIHDEVAQGFAEKLDEMDPDEEKTLRVNSVGGDVFAGWSIITKARENESIVAIKVDGWACSMMAFLLLFFENVECHDGSQFMLHRASGWVDNEDDQKALDMVNVKLKAKLKKKLDHAKFKEITGITIDEMFNMEQRRDLWFTAKEAKQIGLVSKVNSMTPAAKVRMAGFNNEEILSIAAELQGSAPSPKPKTMTEKIMTIESFKSEHKEIYATEVTAIIKAERDRVNAHLAFMEADPEAMVTAIKEGTEMTQTIMAEMTVKLAAKGKLKKIEAETPETPAATDKTKAPKTEMEAKPMVIKTAEGEISLSAEQVKGQTSSIAEAIEAAKERIKIN